MKTDPSVQLSIVSFNVRGIRNREKRRAIFRHMRIRYSRSIVVLQETHSRPNFEYSWKSEWSGRVYFAHGTESGQGGVAILFPRNFPHSNCAVLLNDNGRIACVKIELNGCPDYILLMGVYGPAINEQSEKCKFLDSVREVLTCYANNHTLMVGDFNIKLSNLDSDKSQFCATRSCAKLKDILSEFSLEDSWRLQHPVARSYTWRRTNPLQQSRIDYSFVSSFILQNNEVRSEIETGIMSDHSVITVDIKIGLQPRGPGTWVYNNLLLDDKAHIRDVKEEINKAKFGNDVYSGNINNGVKVEMLLSNIRAMTMRRSKEIAREIRKEENVLYERANELESIISKGPSRKELAEYEDVKRALDDIKESRGRTAILRSQSKWIEEGERSSNYFLRLEKVRLGQSTVHTIQTDSGDFVRDNKQILAACVTHFKSLYSSQCRKGRSFDKFAPDENAPRLSEEERNSCEGPVTKQECKEAIRKMARNKTAGISGFTAEFFDYFWEDVGDIMVDYYNSAREQGQMFITHRRGLLTLIPKRGNQMLLKNKRPICLLDVVYKILAKVIAIRLEMVIGKLISRNQTGFIKGRFIGENLRTISDVIEYCKIDNINGVLLAIDFRNAFDSLEHDFMVYALESFGLGPNFISWIQLLYSNAILTVKNNGFTSDWFECSRGTFQGSPLSGLLFNLAVEMLAIKVRAAANINGITISGQEIRMTQYADDTTLFLNDSYSVCGAMEILHDFKLASGLDINLQKCCIMWLGGNCMSTETVCGITAVRKVKILGVWFSAAENCNEENISPIITKMKSTVNSWAQRSLTIKGRIVITKALIASQLVYIATCTSIARADLKEIQSLIMKYVWRGRPPKVAKGVICLSINKGGLNAVNVEHFYEALRLGWIKRMVKDTDAIWRTTLQLRLKEFDLTDLLMITNCSKMLKELRIPTFYKEIIQSFQDKCRCRSQSASAIRSQCLWYNDKIQIGNEPVYDKAMYMLGIKFVDDIVAREGSIMSYNEITAKYPSLRTKFLSVQALINAIPREWKEVIRQSPRLKLSRSDLTDINIKLDEKLVPIQLVTTSHIYITLSESRIPTATITWAKYGIRPQNWQKIYQIPYNCTSSTRLQSLHYRIINRYIPTRRYLSTRGVIGSPLCRKCFQVDDMKHFFIECEDVASIWPSILTVVKEKYQLSDLISEYQSIILGCESVPPIVNLILLLTKQYIVSCKLAVVYSQPRLENLWKYIKNFALAESITAKRLNRVDQYNEKWGKIVDEVGSRLT